MTVSTPVYIKVCIYVIPSAKRDPPSFLNDATKLMFFK